MYQVIGLDAVYTFNSCTYHEGWELLSIVYIFKNPRHKYIELICYYPHCTEENIMT